MSPALTRYLTESYRHDILHESLEVVMPDPDPVLVAEIKAEIARIDALRLGANLVSRDFASYQTKRALEKLLKQMEAMA